MGYDAAFTDISVMCPSAFTDVLVLHPDLCNLVVSALVFKKTVEWCSMAAERHGTLHAVNCFSTACDLLN